MTVKTLRVKRVAEYDEYQVTVQGESDRHPNPEYFASDKEDAAQTLVAMSHLMRKNGVTVKLPKTTKAFLDKNYPEWKSFDFNKA